MDGNECSYEGSYDGLKSGVSDHVEVRVRSERRRRWSSKDKLAIVRETLAPGSVAQVVADRHGIGTGLIYTWRKQMLKAAMAGFAVVEIKPDVPVALPGKPAAATPLLEPPRVIVTPRSTSPGAIEVELSSGVRLRVGPDVDGAALQRVLSALSVS
jgi:transposase